MLVHKAMSPVRLLHIIGESRFGGVASIILGLGRVAQAEGWQVDVLTTDPVVQKAVIQHGLGVVNLDVIRREIRPLWDLGGLFRLHKFLRRETYHIVHTHTSKGGFVGRLAARLAGVPVILHTAHGFAFHEGSPAATRFCYSALERIASHWCDRIVSVSEFHRDWAIQLGICRPRKITAIPNGVSEAPRNQQVGLEELRSQLGARPTDLLILTIARLAGDKGLEYLIEAAAMLPATARSTHIVIAGDGPARERLKGLAVTLGLKDRVTFVGFREDVGDLLAACDLVILPSYREGLSISLLEAMAARKPILATSIGSQREVRSHGEMAWLVPPADSPALAKAIARLTEDPALMARLGANARAVYESFYTENRMLQAYWELYSDLLRANCHLEATTHIRSFEELLAGPLEEMSPAYAAMVGPHRLPRGGDANRGFTVTQVPATQLAHHITSRTGVVRKANANDLTGIVTIHQKAFGNFFTTRLGVEFLREYYSLVLTYRLGIMLVSEGGHSALEGFACGFVDPHEFYQLMWDTRRKFLLPVVSALIHQPSLITKVLNGVQRIHSSAAEWPERSCELSSIAVAPDVTGNGFGKCLVRAFLAQAQSMDARCVYLTTDADGNDAVNAFYRNVGFQHTRRFLQHEGRWMNEYVINGLEAGNA
jgi:glycosyltransferase involved in cell wall biosynthesis/ribosomal protein S18 acetylase RimI-like enzyme